MKMFPPDVLPVAFPLSPGDSLPIVHLLPPALAGHGVVPAEALKA